MQTDEKFTDEIIENWYKDPNNWKLGIFYFNKEDKRIFPRKRYGYFGCTINFTNPFSILINISIIIAIILLAIYIKSL
jgi:uncharacterized membrane protein